jgi:hypothetical protein
MKAEDIERMWNELRDEETAHCFPLRTWSALPPNDQALFAAFARHSERHGIEHAKAKSSRYQGVMICDFEALDAEVAKENEG